MNFLLKDKQKPILKTDYIQRFHISPVEGNIKCPCGLCFFNGKYHIYYLTEKIGGDNNKTMWSHTVTSDFTNYENCAPIILSDSVFDIGGVGTGSAYINKEGINFFYIGNVNNGNSKEEQNIVSVFSRDAFFTERKRITLKTEEIYPFSLNFMCGPKVWKNGSEYFMIFGASDENNCGCAAVYSSVDMKRWKMYKKIVSDEQNNMRWDTPEAILMGGTGILIFGKTDNDGKYTAGYCNFTGTLAKNFRRLDYGFDFYAPQTFSDDSGHRIMLASLDCRSLSDTESEIRSCLAVPRILYYEKGELKQKPINELSALRESRRSVSLEDGEGCGTFGAVFEAILNFCGESYSVFIRDGVFVHCENGNITIGIDGRGKQEFYVENYGTVRIFSDMSSIELFIDGKSFSARICDRREGGIYIVEGSCRAEIYKMGSFLFNK